MRVEISQCVPNEVQVQFYEILGMRGRTLKVGQGNKCVRSETGEDEGKGKGKETCQGVQRPVLIRE
jgi:hypothetical protein